MAEILQGDMKVPGLGQVKKRYILIPAGLMGGYVIYRWYQASRGDGPSEVPASDGTYSSTPDTSEYGLSTTGGSTTVTGNTGSTTTDATNPNTIDSNAEWTQKAAETLGNAGYDAATVYAALGEFLARRALDKNEATIARAALAAAGQPPVGGPFNVTEEAATNTGTLPAPTNLRAYGTPTTTQIGVQWDAVPGALHYRIFRTDQGDEPIGDSVDTKFNAKGLQPNKSYGFTVAAMGTTNKVGGKSSVFTGKTPAVALTKPTGLKSSSVTRTSFRITISPVKGAEYYRWFLNGKSAGAGPATYRDFPGLKPNTSYRVTVDAGANTQTPGPDSSPLTVKTKK